MLNKALRSRDIDTLILFQFIITDLYEQLKDLHYNHRISTSAPILCVYRGQLLSKVELNDMKSSIGRYVSFFSFLSTTKVREVALSFITIAADASKNMPAAKNDLQRVLYEINIDLTSVTSKPYADIKPHSYFQTESEVLFTLGSIFKVEGITRTKDGIYVIKLVLASESKSKSKELLHYIKSNLEEKPDIISLGHVLKEMGAYDKAEQCFERQLCELKDHSSFEAARCYIGLGNLAYVQGDNDLAFDYSQEALKINESLFFDDENLSVCYNNMANAYSSSKDDYQKALKYHNKSLALKTKTNGGDSLEVARSFFNIGLTNYHQGKYEIALKKFNRSL
ncbi:unnamed protein product, partial [Didymodactylos carnosus]